MTTWKRFGIAALAAAVSGLAGAAEFKEFQSTKYGYALKIPAQFTMDGKEDNTTTWMYQPGSAPAAGGGEKADEGGEKKGKKKKLGSALGGLVKDKADAATPDAPSGDSGGGLQPALSIYVNWTHMPDVDSGTMYSTNKKSDQQNIDSPDPDYKEIKDFDKKQGYAHEGNTYWYKEVDKTDGGEIHRWHIKSYGNKAAYVVGLCGTYEQFKEWGPVYEEVVKSWRLIPQEKK